MQGLNSTREFSTKNYYFAMHILFSTIYLLQGQELNPRIYSKKELIMEHFMQATNNGMHMHAKIKSIIKRRYL
jgi:hypothetical protein